MTATLARPATGRISVWADRLGVAEMDLLATAWRDASFPGRADLRDQAQALLLEADLNDPFAGLSSDLGHALSDLGTLDALLSTRTISTDSPVCRLAYPAADALFDGDSGQVIIAMLAGDWSVLRVGDVTR